MGRNQQGARLRAAAAKIVDAVASDGRSLDAALPEFEARVADTDRPLLRHLCYGSLRHHWRLCYWTDSLLEKPLRNRDSVIAALLRIGLFQLTDTRIPEHAAVSETVEAARILGRPKLAGLLNAVMRRFLRDNVASDSVDGEQARFDHPQWLIDRIKGDWPGDYEQILAANNERAPMWIRANARVGSAADYGKRLTEAGIAFELHEALPQALRLASAVAVTELPGFECGDVSVQDGAAQLAAPWLLADTGGEILDACAAPGGKSAHLLELGGDNIALTSVEKDKGRLRAISENLERGGLDATVLAADASNPDTWWQKTLFDGVLLDAPCSASGVIRRHPDIKLLRRATDINRLSELQGRLMRALWPLLKPGGRLLYVTCSVLAAENDDVVRVFMDATPDARENDLLQNNNIRDLMRRKACGVQVLPGTDGMDGFYFACIEKVS